jgi:hypothetical protein
MLLGELGRHGNLLHSRERDGIELLFDSLHVGRRRNTCGYRAVMHIDRTMKIEDCDGVRDLTVQHTDGDDDTAIFPTRRPAPSFEAHSSTMGDNGAPRRHPRSFNGPPPGTA